MLTASDGAGFGETPLDGRAAGGAGGGRVPG
jgi:hypothetical protein